MNIRRIGTALSAASLALLPLGLATCGPSEPAVRLSVEIGRELVYDVTQRDEFPGPDNPALEVKARIRLTCVEYAPEGGARYDAVVEHLVISGPEKFGLSLDTTTPETEPGDKTGAEDMVRGLLGIKSQLVLSPTGRPKDIRARPELIDPIKQWASVDPRQRGPLGGILAKLVDASVIAATSVDMLANLMPPDARLPSGATWTTRAPAPPSQMRVSLSQISVTLSRPAPAVAVLGGKATLAPETDPNGKGVIEANSNLQSGSLTIEGEIDTARGIIRRVVLNNSMTLVDPGGSGRTLTTQQKRTFVLVEDAPANDPR